MTDNQIEPSIQRNNYGYLLLNQWKRASETYYAGKPQGGFLYGQLSPWNTVRIGSHYRYAGLRNKFLESSRFLISEHATKRFIGRKRGNLLTSETCSFSMLIITDYFSYLGHLRSYRSRFSEYMFELTVYYRQCTPWNFDLSLLNARNYKRDQWRWALNAERAWGQ